MNDTTLPGGSPGAQPFDANFMHLLYVTCPRPKQSRAEANVMPGGKHIVRIPHTYAAPGHAGPRNPDGAGNGQPALRLTHIEATTQEQIPRTGVRAGRR
jgi:hypothetical protein